MASKAWDKTEQRAVCIAWVMMQQASAQGTKFNKSQIRRDLIAGPLAARSPGAVEGKMMNCSAVAERLGLPSLPGYKPAPHYQAELLETMREVWNALVTDVPSAEGISMLLKAV